MQILQSSMGGEISLDSPRRLRAHYPGRFIDALLYLGVGVISLGALSLLVFGVILAGAIEALPGLVPTALMAGWFGFLLRVRRRRMGTFLVDLDQGALVHLRGAREVQRWPLGAVRFETALDPFHRGWGLHRWLVACVPDGRRVRLGKGPKDELARPMQLLASWGLSVAP